MDEEQKVVEKLSEQADLPVKSHKHTMLMVVMAVIILVVAIVAGVLMRKALEGKEESEVVIPTTTAAVSGVPTTPMSYIPNSSDIDSLDPVTKGMAVTYGECDGSGSTTLTHAPMDPTDIGTIAPEGGFGGAHVTPIDHQYYYGLDQKAAADTYPVYAVMDGNVNAVGFVSGQKTSWNLTLSHSCTFMAYYNLMTSLAPEIQAKLPANWKQISGRVKIPVKAGDVIGYSGGQSLDFQLSNTEKMLPGLLYHTAYNNAEPIKISGVKPLDYFSEAVKTLILPKYLRVAEPRDGVYAYDVAGQAIGNWFLVGTNGYAGPAGATTEYARASGHLSLAYDSFDPSAAVLSVGNYQGAPQVFAVKGSVNWTTITKTSGITKVELAQGSLVTPDGAIWNGQYVAGGLSYVPGASMATALIQLLDDEHLKIEIMPGKVPAQVDGFTAAATIYDRGQTATLIESTTRATP